MGKYFPKTGENILLFTGFVFSWARLVDEKESKNPEKILRNAHVDKKGSVVAEKGKWTK